MKVLVLGASMNEDRYSNKAIKKLVAHSFEVAALGNKIGEVNGIEIKKELFPFENIHTITLYLNPQNQKPYYDYILSLKPQRVIFNPGTENAELQELLKRNHIPFEEACTLVMLGMGVFDK
jgi:predicted CoA-binding protein